MWGLSLASTSIEAPEGCALDVVDDLLVPYALFDSRVAKDTPEQRIPRAPGKLIPAQAIDRERRSSRAGIRRQRLDALRTQSLTSSATHRCRQVPLHKRCAVALHRRETSMSRASGFFTW